MQPVGFEPESLPLVGYAAENGMSDMQLDKLQFNGIDSVETVDLHSGKEPAKAARKELVRQAEKLSARIDKIFKQIKEAEKSR
ncbi:hypothetical protein Pmar_PMAR020655 [Perkinsus marinus ATCC 50983]|uniref:Uncharacterized protein n=1 Tax=Perkinsus marinus (strain ATCC 50983 / TXsc) TaxID=423536 RepID=C5L7M9_PERM5|nr:hypothetical protein Pmar_PMAR020655 [Perkinsus marinus ATCC 50983]EER07491.1 hypothetical protein Pmar_PMAR020655 [Perkinsus marinus ATCC 50983]|eukprot:XP_002775675.1 hypothetical protein Pmar_PMAR020655 [Perkinsus marinus ATCC 50983]